MIPIVHDLLQKSNKVILGGDGDALQLISDEFPELDTIRIPDIQVRFSKNKMTLNLIRLIPKILISSVREHYFLKKLANTNTIDVIISDNRYGLWNKNIKSILVTHQLMVKLPAPFSLLEGMLHQVIKLIINLFNECWIPDYADHGIALSGDLSHKHNVTFPSKFIGPLSRFSCINELATEYIYDIVAVLSGPEPTRTQLEEELKKILLATERAAIIIQGKPREEAILKQHKNLHVIPHLRASQLKYVLLKSKLCLCRSGYSSIMDIAYLNLNAILIPTPGQTEQEYLAHHLKDRFKVVPQKKIGSHLLGMIGKSFGANK
ncbi:glycosyltransferase [Saccharicrinis sp. 156]|uniref:glycosyltransferase n=1 Tax=Saccharicrinis sp. 156 TaxID=3417574 RepID=UPI003D3513E1